MVIFAAGLLLGLGAGGQVPSQGEGGREGGEAVLLAVTSLQRVKLC